MNKDDYTICLEDVRFSIYDKDDNPLLNEHGWTRKFAIRAKIDADFDFSYIAENLTVDDLEEVY